MFLYDLRCEIFVCVVRLSGMTGHAFNSQPERFKACPHGFGRASAAEHKCFSVWFHKMRPYAFRKTNDIGVVACQSHSGFSACYLYRVYRSYSGSHWSQGIKKLNYGFFVWNGDIQTCDAGSRFDYLGELVDSRYFVVDILGIDPFFFEFFSKKVT